MEERRKGRRWMKRIAAGVLLLVVVMVVLALTYSWWLPAAARPIAKRYGITYGKFERLEDGRFALSDVVRTNRHFDLQIAKVEGYLPHVWRSKLSATNHETAFIEVNGWKVVVHETPRRDRGRAGKGRAERSVYEEWERVEKYIAKAREWVPKATLLNGAVQHKAKEYTISLATWCGAGRTFPARAGSTTCPIAF